MILVIVIVGPFALLLFGAVASQTTFYAITTGSITFLHGIPCISAFLLSLTDQMSSSNVSSVCLISATVFENALVSEISSSSMILAILCSVILIVFFFHDSKMFYGPIRQELMPATAIGLMITFSSSNFLGHFTFLASIYAWHRANRDFKLQFTILEHHALLLWTGIFVYTATRRDVSRIHTEEYHLQQILYAVHSGLAAVLCILLCIALIFGIDFRLNSGAAECRLSSCLIGTKIQKCFIFLFLFVGGVLLLLVPSLSYVLGTNPAVWIMNFLVMDNYSRLRMAAYWACLVILFVFAANALATHSTLPKFCNRKLFHLLMILVIAPGLLATSMFSFTILALGVAFCAFLVLETFRVLVLVPYGADPISSYYDMFLDRTDCRRPWTSSNISLLIGCAFPAFIWAHWLDPPQCDSSVAAKRSQGGDNISGSCAFSGAYHSRILQELKPLSPHLGWITVGVGDSLAAIVGSQYGKQKWEGTSRTKEGSFAMFLSMFLVALCVVCCSGVDDWPTLSSMRVERLLSFRTVFPIFVTLALSSVCEAFASENDNLILPLFSVALYVAIVSCIV